MKGMRSEDERGNGKVEGEKKKAPLRCCGGKIVTHKKLLMESGWGCGMEGQTKRGGSEFKTHNPVIPCPESKMMTGLLKQIRSWITIRVLKTRIGTFRV
jgi:hypothetical protein